MIDRNSIRSCYTDASLKPYSTFNTNTSASHLCGTTTMITPKMFRPPLPNQEEKSCSSPVINTQNNPINKPVISFPKKRESPSKPSPMSLSVPMLVLPMTTETNIPLKSNSQLIKLQHPKKTKVTQSASSSLSDFMIQQPISTLKSTSEYFVMNLLLF